jgi:ATP-dependent DNA ligase
LIVEPAYCGPSPRRQVPEAVHPPKWIEPQLTRLVDEAPTGKEWLHEIKYDGYRMHGRLDRGEVQDRLRRDR